jgi:hypothetical protein
MSLPDFPRIINSGVSEETRQIHGVEDVALFMHGVFVVVEAG